MVEVVEIDPKIEIERCLSGKKNFAVIGGAGSGKTTILKNTIENVLKYIKLNKMILCITYTNVAVNEIKERISDDRLYVSTFHEFFWDFVKQYQKEIKDIILNQIDNSEIKVENSKDNPELTREIKIEMLKKTESIDYRNYRKIEDGIISHDEIIKLASKIFENKVLKNRFTNIFPYVFVDEFQDTKKDIVNIFLGTDSTIGFFGDPMQAIYEDGIGDLNEYINNDKIYKILKQDNYRNPPIVIDIINKLRITDDLKQKARGNNERNNTTKCIFLYSDQERNIKEIKSYIQNKFSVNFNNPDNSKILYLTHNLKAKANNYSELKSKYDKQYGSLRSNEELFEGNNKIIKHLIKIQNLISVYQQDNFNEFIKQSNYKIRKIDDKIKLKEYITVNCKIKSIEEVIEYFNEKGLIIKDDNINDFIIKNEEFYNNLKTIKYIDFFNLYGELNHNLEEESKKIIKKSISSTQHGIKGAEFDNILVVLDNGNWRNYDFSMIFKDKNSITNDKNDKIKIFNRTKKIFYVSVSRTKDNCFIYAKSPIPDLLNGAKEFFKEENIHKMEIL